VDLSTGERERTLPGHVMSQYAISANGNKVLFTSSGNRAGDGIWIADLDHRSVARQLTHGSEFRAFFGGPGEIIYLPGCLRGCRYLLHDRDTKFCESFRELIESGSVKPIRLPARSPNLNSYAERWVRSVKEECLSKFILFGESSLRRALQQYMLHYHEERNHQGKENRILFPSQTKARRKEGAVRCRERLGGLLRYYEREAA
jgi:hypothetical protein